MADLLLIAWLASAGVERLDLLGGGDFLLTPFLLLTPILVASEVARVVGRRGTFVMPPGAGRFFMVVSAFLCIVLLSTLFARDVEVSARRYVLLLLQIYAGLIGVVALANRPDPRRILVLGAFAALAVHLAFNSLQLWVWFTGVSGFGDGDGMLYLEPGNYFGIIPRLTGGSRDPNRGGLIALVFIYILARFGNPSRVRTAFITLGVISILFTLSRSAVLASIGVVAFIAVTRMELRVPRGALVGAAVAIGALMVTYMVSPWTFAPLAEPLEILSGRLSVAEGSSSEHLEVLQRGWEVGTADLKRVLLGVGYGNSYLTLQDIFPGNKYGNFHSLFVTLFAESGVFAAALGAVILLYPLLRPGVFRPLIAGLFLYNLFQQSHVDAVAWLVLALAWTRVGQEAVGEEAETPDEAGQRRTVAGAGVR